VRFCKIPTGICGWNVGSDDAEPFPYDLTEEELKAEVRYSLGLEVYPE